MNAFVPVREGVKSAFNRSPKAFDGPGQRFLIYIACHGYGGRLTPGRKPDSGVNLAPIARALCQGVESVWLGACDVGGSNALHDFLADGGAVWAGGYRCSVNWDASLLLDMAVLQELLKSGPRKTRTGVVGTLKQAMKGFDPRWIIGSTSAAENPLPELLFSAEEMVKYLYF